MALDGMAVTVVGGGIGGLAAALALRARGASVTVFEQAPEIAEVGAGLQITPNGLAVLEALGVAGALRREAVRARAVVLRDHARPGEVLRLDLARHAPDLEYLFVHRADLVEALADAARAAGVRLRLLQRVERVEPAGDGDTGGGDGESGGARPAVILAGGRRAEADLIVGADGLHSRARAALNPASAPFFTRQVAWRAVVPNDLGLGPEAQLFMGPGRHLVCYPLRQGRVVNLVAVQERDAWAAEGWHHRDSPDNLRAAFAGFAGLAGALLARVESVALWGLFRHPVAERWQGGGVAILGDAAHPTLPFMAQGANLALEDAWVLADSLARAATPAAGLAAYQARRRARAARIVAAAGANAWKYHLRAAPLRRAAHLALGLGGALAPRRMLRRFDWIYRHDVTAA